MEKKRLPEIETDFNDLMWNHNNCMDTHNPKMMFQGMDSDLVQKVATGEINAQDWARYEMAQRGLGTKGEWVGFKAAAEIWIG